ncbi:MAG: hypothetical protein LBE76_01440 [Nitrososphaerota archaeon]|nr:hypothetical protein [Nitrososphaerota archaeon]
MCVPRLEEQLVKFKEDSNKEIRKIEAATIAEEHNQLIRDHFEKDILSLKMTCSSNDERNLVIIETEPIIRQLEIALAIANTKFKTGKNKNKRSFNLNSIFGWFNL